jgi:amidase
MSSEATSTYAVEEIPLSAISADLESGTTTSFVLTSAYVDRIAKYDDQLRAVILIAPDAMDQARAADRRRAAGRALGPLDGVPILVKDNIDAAGMPTTAGSYALADNVPATDSEVVRRLRAAGAVILGKTNLSQFSGFRTTVKFNGSSVGGSPRNPYDPARWPGSSSSGSGIATAVSFAAAAIGTETAGSVVWPASVNGLVGLKPTIALVSRRGIVPISHNMDTAGPMTRNVSDAAILLTVMAGSDSEDRRSADADAHKADYHAGLNPGALEGRRIGVLRDLDHNSPQTDPLLDAALEVLAAEGAAVVEIASSGFTDLNHEMYRLLTHEFSEDLDAYLAGTPVTQKHRSLADLMAYNLSDSREQEALLGQDVFAATAAIVGGRKNPEYVRRLRHAEIATRADGIDRLLEQYGVSALIGVTFPPAPEVPPDGTPPTINYLTTPPEAGAPGSMTNHAAIAGYPHLTVPMGQVNGLPVGLSFVGPAWSEQLLLSLGHSYERAAQVRRPPRLAVGRR